MSNDNKELNFADIIPLKVRADGETAYSKKSDTAKREIAVVAALQILNSHAQSAEPQSTLPYFSEHLPAMTQAILDALEGNTK